MDVETIGRDELKTKLDRGDDFKLVMTLKEWSFDVAHIPGSINLSSVEAGARLLGRDDVIVVYFSDEACVASQNACRTLREGGYENVRRYAGGLSDWTDAGHPLEGHSAGG
jgi:rhodanese-related sulfurtransferase